MSETMIEVNHATFRYEGRETDAVKDVSLRVQKGEFLAILGRNGSGKSTLAKMLNALITPSSGEIRVCGLRVETEDDAYLVRQKCGMVFQNPDNQTVATIVEEDVAFGPENLGVAPEEIRSRVDWALETVGMSQQRKSAPHMLSGGQKQRVAIAGVIAMKPEIIVFDESTSMLDPVGRADILRVARQLNRENGVTVIWITHFLDEAAQADRVIVMTAGECAMEGSPREVFSKGDALRGYGLEAPEMTALAKRLRAAGIPVAADVMTVEEMEVELCRLK